jgi:hypothetical protein
VPRVSATSRSACRCLRGCERAGDPLGPGVDLLPIAEVALGHPLREFSLRESKLGVVERSEEDLRVARMNRLLKLRKLFVLQPHVAIFQLYEARDTHLSFRDRGGSSEISRCQVGTLL